MPRSMTGFGRAEVEYRGNKLTVEINTLNSRFLEYQTSLLLKAAVFTACGIGLIIAGVAFENHLKKRRLADE